MQLETVKIVSKENDSGFVIINKSDMKDTDKLYKAKQQPKKQEASE